MLPKKYVIKKKDVVLGSTTRSGFMKRLVGKKGWGDGYCDSLNEFLGILNDHKPVAIINEDMIKNRLVKEPELIKYLKKNPLFILYTDSSATRIIWKKKMLTKNTLLLKYLSPKILKDLRNKTPMIENKLSKLNTKYLYPLKSFFRYYIIGTLLGYRRGEIKGYYLSSLFHEMLHLHNIKYYEDTKENTKLYVKNLKKMKRLFMKTNDYTIFEKEYPKFERIVNDFIKYMLTESTLFKKYYDDNLETIHKFDGTKIIKCNFTKS